jgi:hypothetical protein
MSDNKLLLATFAGPLAWGAQLWVLYIVASETCATAWVVAMVAVSLLAFAATVWGFVYARRAWRSIPDEELVAPRPRRIRGHAGGAMMISGFFLIVTIAQGLPVLIVPSCP